MERMDFMFVRTTKNSHRRCEVYLWDLRRLLGKLGIVLPGGK